MRQGFTRCDSLRELARVLMENPDGAARIAFRGGVRDVAAFEQFCRLAFVWGRLKPCTIIVEELSWVTSPGKAPPGWHELVTGGLKYGIHLVSITQRPQESDKTALSQADIVRCFMLDRAVEHKYMSGELGVPPERVAELAPLEFIEKNRRTRAVSHGKLTF